MSAFEKCKHLPFHMIEFTSRGFVATLVIVAFSIFVPLTLPFYLIGRLLHRLGFIEVDPEGPPRPSGHHVVGNIFYKERGELERLRDLERRMLKRERHPDYEFCVTQYWTEEDMENPIPPWGIVPSEYEINTDVGDNGRYGNAVHWRRKLPPEEGES